MRIVGEEPGITVRGISDRLRVNRPDLYRLTNALAKRGRLRKDGPKLYLAENPPA
jgi:DNA-binding IclR family transcriptional regulator